MWSNCLELGKCSLNASDVHFQKECALTPLLSAIMGEDMNRQFEFSVLIHRLAIRNIKSKFKRFTSIFGMRVMTGHTG